MKKSIFTLLVVALAAPMMFNSCKGGGGDDPTPTPSDLPVPPKAADAIKVVINPPATQPLKDYPVSFEYTETGKAIVGFKSPTVLAGIPVKSEAGSEIYYITGSGSKSGNVYTITGPDSKTYKFEIIQSVPQVQIKYMDPDGGSLDFMGKLQAVVMTSQFFTNLCRSWKVLKTRVSIVAEGVNAAAEWPNATSSAACDLNEIEKFASQYYTITDKLPQGMRNMWVSGPARFPMDSIIPGKRTTWASSWKMERLVSNLWWMAVFRTASWFFPLLSKTAARITTRRCSAP